VRQYASEKLASAGCLDDSYAAHARFYSAFIARQVPCLVGHKQKKSLADIQIEFSNIRSRFSEGIAMFQPVIALLEEDTKTEAGQAIETA
jgi:hypothetical protein